MVTVIVVAGLLTSLVFTALAFISYVTATQIWLSELTEGREDGGAPVVSALFAVGFVLIMFGGACLAAAYVAGSANAGYWPRFAVAWGVIAFVCVYDFVVIDVALYMWIKPGFMRFPGYPRLDAYGPHLWASLKGIFPIGLPMAGASSGVSYLLV